MHPVDVAMATLAERQQSLFTVQQVIAAGGNRSLVRRRVNSGHWVRHGPCVLGFPGSAPTFERQLRLGLLDAGADAMASHEASAHFHDLATFPPRLAVLVGHGRHHRNCVARVHQTRRLPDPVMIEGFPVTPAARTLVDLAGQYGTRRMGIAVDDAHVRRICSVGQVQRTFLELARPGRPGITVMRTVLEHRVTGYSPNRSVLEDALDEMLALVPGPPPTKEVRLPTDDGRPLFVDRCYECERLIVEGDGRRWHSRYEELERDRWRDRVAAGLGYRVLRYGWDDLTRERAECAAEVTRALGR